MTDHIGTAARTDRRTLLAGLAGTAAGTLCGGPAAAHFASAVPQSAPDMAVLRAALSIHPGLLRYATAAQVDVRLAALEQQWATNPALEARYLALSRFLTTLQCGHSYANFFNQSAAVASALFDRPTRLSFAFAWVDGDMVVLSDHSGTGALPRGTRVMAVNGVASADLLAALLPYVRADGGNDGKRKALLEMRGADGIETFDVFQGLLFPPTGGVHRLIVIPPGGAARIVEVPAVGLAARRAAFPAPDENAEPWQWVMDGDTAVLTMPGWALYNSRFDWRDWLDTRLDSLGSARGLIVDIRDNEGGLDCGDAIVARLIDTPVAAVDAQQRIRFRTLPPLVEAHGTTWDESFKTMGVGAAELADGFYTRPGAEAGSRIEPASPAKRLRLPVALLTSPTNSSATFAFAECAKRTGIMRLFGQPTGGNRRGINGGAFMFVTLPESGIQFDLPLVGTFPREPQPDAGIEPDVTVRTTAADIAAGRDPVMSAAKAWVVAS